jgi:hypothetical protein
VITVIRRFTYQVTSDKPLLKQARWVGGYEPRVKARSERVYNTVQMGVTLENKIVIYFLCYYRCIPKYLDVIIKRWSERDRECI